MIVMLQVYDHMTIIWDLNNMILLEKEIIEGDFVEDFRIQPTHGKIIKGFTWSLLDQVLVI